MVVGDVRDLDDPARVHGWFLAVQALELAIVAVGLLAFGRAAAGLNNYLTAVSPGHFWRTSSRTRTTSAVPVSGGVRSTAVRFPLTSFTDRNLRAVSVAGVAA